MSLTRVTCSKCGHAWLPRQDVVRRCPNCGSVRWDVANTKPRYADPEPEAGSPFTAAFFTAWDANGFPQITQILAANVSAFEDEWFAKWKSPPEKAVAIYAIAEAVVARGFTFSYVQIILNRCLTAGGVPPKPQETNGNGNGRPGISRQYPQQPTRNEQREADMERFERSKRGPDAIPDGV